MLQRKKQQNKKSQRLVIGFLLIVLGGYLVSFSYIQSKRQEIFDHMNLKLYHFQEENKTVEVEVPDIVSVEKTEENHVVEEEKIEETTLPEKTPVTSDTTRYIGMIEISKIGLKTGFVSMDSEENDVDKHVAIMPTSNYPNVSKGNFILAAHSGQGKIAYFNDLYKLQEGDIIQIQYGGNNYQYHITAIYQEPKNGKVAIHRNFDRTTLTLITCTNHDKNTQTVYISERND